MRGTVRCAKRGCDRARKSMVCEHCGHTTCYVSVYWNGKHYKYRRDESGQVFTDYRRAETLLALIHHKLNDPRAKFAPEEFLAQKVQERRFEVQAREWLKLKTEESAAGELSFETLKNYKGYSKHYFGHFKGYDVREIQASDLEHFLSSLRFRKLSIKTRKNILAALHALFTWMRRKGTQKGGISEVPAWPVIKGEDAVPRTAIDYETQNYGLAKIPEEHRDVFEFGFETGLRPGELCALQSGDVDLKLNRISVQRTWSGSRLRETTKGHTKKGVPLSPRAREIAEKALRDKMPTAFLFLHPGTGRCYRPKVLNNIWKEFSGLTIDHYSAGRHSFVTQLIEDGANIFDVQELARHSDINSTRQYYHASTARLEQVVAGRGKVRQLQDAKNKKQDGSRTKKQGVK